MWINNDSNENKEKHGRNNDCPLISSSLLEEQVFDISLTIRSTSSALYFVLIEPRIVDQMIRRQFKELKCQVSVSHKHNHAPIMNTERCLPTNVTINKNATMLDDAQPKYRGFYNKFIRAPPRCRV